MKGVLVETDLIVEYLTAPAGEIPLLRKLLTCIPCYTTFLHAAEIYSAARGDEERRTAELPLFGLKILGASSRYAKTIGGILSSEGREKSYRSAIVSAMAIESHLPVVTDRYLTTYSTIPGLRVIAGARLRVLQGDDLLRALEE